MLIRKPKLIYRLPVEDFEDYKSCTHHYPSCYTPTHHATPLPIVPHPTHHAAPHHATPLPIVPCPYPSRHAPTHHATPLSIVPHPIHHATHPTPSHATPPHLSHSNSTLPTRRSTLEQIWSTSFKKPTPSPHKPV